MSEPQRFLNPQRVTIDVDIYVEMNIDDSKYDFAELAEDYDVEVIITKKEKPIKVGDKLISYEQLDKLPACSIVIDVDGDVLQKSDGGGENEGKWAYAWSQTPLTSKAIEIHRPHTVVSVGGNVGD